MISLPFEGLYKLGSFLGKGTFSSVYEVTNTEKNCKNAIKITFKSISCLKTSLSHERDILNCLERVDGIPKILNFISNEQAELLILPLYEITLQDLLLKKKKLSTDLIAIIGLEIIKILENIHNNDIVHRDLKPENIMILKNKIFIIDFGLASKYLDENKNHIKFVQNKSFIGSPTFASTHAHLGYNLSRRDDIESLAYILLFMFCGKLPWQNKKIFNFDDQIKSGFNFKKNLNLEESHKNIPKFIKYFFMHSKKLAFEEKPNYEFLKKILNNEIKNFNEFNEKFIIDELEALDLELKNEENNFIEYEYKSNVKINFYNKSKLALSN